MNERRIKRKSKKRKPIVEDIPCIIFLSTDEIDSFEIAEKKENRQLHYINEYADAHDLVPMKIVRRGCFAPAIRNKMFMDCVYMMCAGKAKAILVANTSYIASNQAEIYQKIGMVRQHGFRFFSVDEGELKMELKPIERKARNSNG